MAHAGAGHALSVQVPAHKSAAVGHDGARTLEAWDHGELLGVPVFALQVGEVGWVDDGGFDAHQHLAGVGLGDGDLLLLGGLLEVLDHDCPHNLGGGFGL